jgi:hypothetical protein
MASRRRSPPLSSCSGPALLRLHRALESARGLREGDQTVLSQESGQRAQPVQQGQRFLQRARPPRRRMEKAGGQLGDRPRVLGEGAGSGPAGPGAPARRAPPPTACARARGAPPRARAPRRAPRRWRRPGARARRPGGRSSHQASSLPGSRPEGSRHRRRRWARPSAAAASAAPPRCAPAGNRRARSRARAGGRGRRDRAAAACRSRR